MQVSLPPPKTWDDFELWSRKVIEKMFPIIDFKRYGRLGQKQFGIDIISISQSEAIVVQCKNTEVITQKKVNNELKKISEYEGHINKYFIFTTALRDRKVLDFIREINSDIQIIVYFWEDICEIIQADSELMTEYCTSVNVNINSHRMQDIKIIKNIMGTMHIPTLTKTLNEMPRYIDADFLGVYQECFNSMVSHYNTFIHDEELKRLFTKLSNDMVEMLNIGVQFYTFNQEINLYVFYMPGDFFPNELYEQGYNSIDKQRYIVYNDYNDLHEYIMKNYPEVDLLELSNNARKEL